MNVSLHGSNNKRKAAAVVTPEKAAAGPRKRVPVLIEGPRAKKARKEEADADAELDLTGEAEQPEYEALVRFDRHSKPASAIAAKLYRHIQVRSGCDQNGCPLLTSPPKLQSNYIIPDDITLDKRAFGPISGQTMHSRVLSAFESGKLQLKPGKARRLFCLCCGAEDLRDRGGAGHRSGECPAAL
jgi:hypothetical protein